MRRDRSNNKTRVLLFVTTRRRDLFPMKKIAAELSEFDDYSVLLSGMSDFLFSILDFQPHIVFFGKVDNAQGDWLRCLSDCTIFSMNTEQGGMTHESILFKHIEGHSTSEGSEDRGPALDLVDHHLIIDDESKNVLSPYLDRDRMHVVGYPRLVRDQFSLIPKPVNDKMVIGVTCGNNPTNDYLLTHFKLYRKKSFPPWENIEAALIDEVLESLWINYLVSQLRSDYHLIVRYRPGDGSYLQDSEDIEIDRSDSLEYLFSSIDLLIVGTSTTGIEALLAGIPSIGVSSLIQPISDYVGAKDFPVPRLIWQPKTLEQFLELVEARANDDLGLSPNMVAFEDIARGTYYNGKETDDSIKSIVEVVRRCERGLGAQIDLPRLACLQPFSRRERVLLWIARVVSSRLARRLCLIYVRARKRLTPDSYLLHHVYLPD